MPNDLNFRIWSDDPRLGRRIQHDPRSLRYLLDTTGGTVADVDWGFHVPTLNQGQVGCCTACAATETLASDPFWSTLPPAVQSQLGSGSAFFDRFYSDEEVDDGDGPYPPNDNGSSGLTSAKVALARGYISGYQHTTTAQDAIIGLQTGPAQWGTLWKTGMDDVDVDTGQVKYTGTTRGGHELCLYKVDAQAEQMWFHNHWGAWGYQNSGVAWISFADFAKSLADQGDVTFFTPLTQPAPTPTPAPADPLSVFAAVAGPWAAKPHTGSNRAMATATRAYLNATGSIS